MRRTLALTFVVLGVAVLLARTAFTANGSRPAAAIQSSEPPKPARGPAQQKLGSKLRYEIARARDLAKSPPAPRQETGVKIDDRRRALVDVRAAVTSDLRDRIDTMGGTVVSSVPEYESTIAWIPLLMLERLAKSPSVKSIVPAAELALH